MTQFSPEPLPVSGDGAPAPRTLLNVGCGPRGITVLGPDFPPEEWREIRLDIDPRVEPDIVASITDMAPVADASVDAVWSAHNLEHLWAHEVPAALGEFLRVLKPGGQLFLIVPDLQAAARAVADDQADEALYMSRAGGITPLDVIYGYGPAVQAGNRFMAHRTGFTPGIINRAIEAAGFAPWMIWRHGEAFELRVKAFRPPAPPEALRELGIGPDAAG